MAGFINQFSSHDVTVGDNVFKLSCNLTPLAVMVFIVGETLNQLPTHNLVMRPLASLILGPGSLNPIDPFWHVSTVNIWETILLLKMITRKIRMLCTGTT